jgi:hypothetical protein
MKRKEIKECRAPWECAIINPDGGFRVCMYSGRTLGSLASSTPGELWNGPEIQALRRAILENRLTRYCAGAGCPHVLGDTDITA